MELKYNSQNMTSSLEYVFTEDLIKFLEQSKQCITTLDACLMQTLDLEDGMDDLENTYFEDIKEFSARGGTQVAMYFDPQYADRVRRAVCMFYNVRTQVMDRVLVGSTLTLNEVADSALILRYAVSEVAGAALATLGFLDVEPDSTPWVISQGLNMYLFDTDTSPEDFLKMFTDVLANYSGSLPVRISNPGLWSELVDKLQDSSEFCDQVLDFSGDLTEPDCKAIVSGKIEINDDLIALLQERHEQIAEKEGVRFTVPHHFQIFLGQIPEVYSDLLIRYETKLTPERVRDVVSGVPIDTKFIKSLESGSSSGSDEYMTRMF